MAEEKNRGGHPGGENANDNTPYEPAERLEIIKVNIGKSYKELAKLCKCSMSTIYLDMQKWRAQGGFEDFLQEEFLNLHEIVRRSDPDIAYKTIAGLLGKHITRKIEAGVTLDFGKQFTDLMVNTFGVERESEDDTPRDEAGKPVQA